MKAEEQALVPRSAAGRTQPRRTDRPGPGASAPKRRIAGRDRTVEALATSASGSLLQGATESQSEETRPQTGPGTVRASIRASPACQRNRDGASSGELPPLRRTTGAGQRGGGDDNRLALGSATGGDRLPRTRMPVPEVRETSAGNGSRLGSGSSGSHRPPPGTRRDGCGSCTALRHRRAGEKSAGRASRVDRCLPHPERPDPRCPASSRGPGR